ncbi:MULTISPECIES: DUF5397 family protein [unclassified Sphingomonas]|uniref:DUF5397 family protein n=1 Tax=unclassified Sphingomonas TaxID=196159 RepID=UPI00268A6544
MIGDRGGDWRGAMTKMDILVGTVRRIGRNGPPYEVMCSVAPASNGKHQMRIHMIESDEDLDYPVEDILRDPLDD